MKRLWNKDKTGDTRNGTAAVNYVSQAVMVWTMLVASEVVKVIGLKCILKVKLKIHFNPITFTCSPGGIFTDKHSGYQSLHSLRVFNVGHPLTQPSELKDLKK